MEILTYKKVYQLVGDSASGTNECITKSAAVEIAQAHRKNVTSNLSQYLNNEYIDVFAVEDKPDLSTFSFANNRYNPQAAGNTYTTSVSSRDIDGNTITYNATSDVDWITDIVISGTEIRFKVNANIGDQRTGHINGSNATGKSDTITIIQEAKAADIDYTYSLIATCTSVPTVTINGISITRYTTSGNTYTFQYTTRVRTESEAPEFVDFTISGGGDGVSYDEGLLSVSPGSWDLNEGLSKQFIVDYIRVKTTKVWDHSSGTIARNGSTNVQLNSTTQTEHPNIEYTIGDSHPSGQSFSHSKNGMQFTSAASSVDCTGQIFVQYNGLSTMINVIYNRPEEVFPYEWTYLFYYDVGESHNELTSLTKQYYANGQEISSGSNSDLNGITSYRIRTGSFGTVQRENISYTGEIERPSGYNYSEQEVNNSGHLVQDGSNIQLDWSYTQNANVKVYGISADPTSLHFSANGGTSDVQVTTWYTWQYNDNNNQQFDQVTTTEQITAEANTSLQQKTWTEVITKNNQSVSIECTQDGREEVFTYKYFIKVGYNLDTLLNDRIQLVWQNDQYSQSSKKTFYIKSFKCKINERGETVATEETRYDLRHNSSGSDNFSISNRIITTGLGQVDCFPIEENTSYQSQKLIDFQVYNVEDGTVSCDISLIQEKKGIQIISGDAVMFTYNWDKGTDLDQATFVNLNLPASNDRNYAGFFGRIISEYQKILYFAGDNTGTGNEYAFIDFKEISKYLNEHMDDQSSIDGKTILQSLTDDNGAIKIQCDLYTNWFSNKEQENITLSYSVYNKDSEDASITIHNTQFVLNGYTKIKDSSDQALCYAKGVQNVSDNVNVKDGYTLSAKFIYYLDSGVFAFETNKDDVGKWHKGTSFSAVRSSASYSNVQFTKDDNNIDFSISIDSINEPDYFDKNNKVIFDAYVHQKGTSNYYTIGEYETTINQLPYRLESSIPLSNVIKDMIFGENNTVEIYPRVSFISTIINYSEEKYLDIRDISLVQNVLTLQKQNT